MAENAQNRISINLVGPFQVVNSDGRDCTPRGRKSCALLALLALSPNKKRGRRWLQDKLWSDRGSEQGAASLRQSLAEIRRILGSDKGCLIVDRSMIALDSDRILIETESNIDQQQLGDSELLEGLEIKDPEFEHWLRNNRMIFKNQREQLRGISQDNCESIHFGERTTSHKENQYQLILAQESQDRSNQNRVVSDILGDIVAKMVVEFGSVTVLDYRDGTLIDKNTDHEKRLDTTLVLRIEVRNCEAGSILRIVLTDAVHQRLIWSSVVQKENSVGIRIDDLDILRELNKSVEVTLAAFVDTLALNLTKQDSTGLCLQGIQTMLRLGQQNFLLADKLFAQAYELNPRGIYLAWRAYVRTFQIAELQCHCRETIADEALSYMSLALEKEPHNSIVASICAHVQTIVLRSYASAYELAKHSIELNRANALGWACLGIVRGHLGQAEQGYNDTLIARDLAGSSPFRFLFDALCCIVGSVAGKYEDAIRFGEASHTMSPSFAPPLRFLSALYLKNGQYKQSMSMVKKMQKLEPNFSYDLLKEEGYPAASLRKTELLSLLP